MLEISDVFYTQLHYYEKLRKAVHLQLPASPIRRQYVMMFRSHSGAATVALSLLSDWGRPANT